MKLVRCIRVMIAAISAALLVSCAVSQADPPVVAATVIKTTTPSVPSTGNHPTASPIPADLKNQPVPLALCKGVPDSVFKQFQKYTTCEVLQEDVRKKRQGNDIHGGDLADDYNRLWCEYFEPEDSRQEVVPLPLKQGHQADAIPLPLKAGIAPDAVPMPLKKDETNKSSKGAAVPSCPAIASE